MICFASNGKRWHKRAEKKRKESNKNNYNHNNTLTHTHTCCATSGLALELELALASACAVLLWVSSRTLSISFRCCDGGNNNSSSSSMCICRRRIYVVREGLLCFLGGRGFHEREREGWVGTQHLQMWCSHPCVFPFPMHPDQRREKKVAQIFSICKS